MPVFPHITVGFLFSCLHPARRRSRPPRPRPPRASHLTPLISHNSSHTTHLTHLISYITSHTPFISHTTLTQLIADATYLTQLISHTTHLTHNSSHTQLISHTTHLNSSHTTHLTHNSSHTQLISHTSSHRRVAWQAQYSEPPEGAAARIVAGWATALLCVAGAVHRGF